jgi:hypothetical protein
MCFGGGDDEATVVREDGDGEVQVFHCWLRVMS